MQQLLILSGKGGTGKTTIASAMIRLSAAKAYADCDVDAPNLHLVAGWDSPPDTANYYGLPIASINPALCTRCGRCLQHCRFGAIFVHETYAVDPFSCEGCGVCAYVCPVAAVSLTPAVAGELNLYADAEKVFSTARLNMGSGTSGLLVTAVKKRMQSAAAAAATLAIIDGSPGIGCPVIASLSGVDMVLIVAEPSVSGISDMARIVATAAKFATKTAVCINKYDTNLQHTEKIQQFCATHGLPFVGKIPFDHGAVQAVNSGRTIVDIPCAAGAAVQEVYHKTMAILLEEGGDKTNAG